METPTGGLEMDNEHRDPTRAPTAQGVRLMARRMALLYYAFARTLIAELGQEEGRRVLARATWTYGELCGERVRRGVEALGLPLTPDNYGKVPDLPGEGWEFHTTVQPSGEIHTTCTYCPLAALWQELDAQDVGRIYCHMDQARWQAYNPEYEFVHTQTVLSGGTHCEWVIRKHIWTRRLEGGAVCQDEHS
jgi:hypothetical protein